MKPAGVTILHDDLSNPEGPVCGENGWYVTEMNRGQVTELRTDGLRRIVARTGRPNGLALDREGRIWIAESTDRCLAVVEPGGEVRVAATGSVDCPFLWPNDLCFGPDGSLFMTDSGMLFDQMARLPEQDSVYDLDLDGRIFRIDTRSGEARVVDRGLRFANGIAVGPGGEALFASETLTGNVYRYRIEGNTLGPRTLYGNVMASPPESFGAVAGPDGMAFDAGGRLYVAVLRQGDVTILGADGDVAARIPLWADAFPTNVAFPRNGDAWCVITEGTKNVLLRAEADLGGLPLFY